MHVARSVGICDGGSIPSGRDGLIFGSVAQGDVVGLLQPMIASLAASKCALTGCWVRLRRWRIRNAQILEPAIWVSHRARAGGME